MFDQYFEIGNRVIDAVVNHPAIIGFVLTSTGVVLTVALINKIVKIYTEITSSRVFAAIFLSVSTIYSLIDTVFTSTGFDPSHYGKNTTLLIGMATVIFHGYRIIKSVVGYVRTYAPVLLTRGKAIKTALDEAETIAAPTVAAPMAEEPAAPSDSRPVGSF